MTPSPPKTKLKTTNHKKLELREGGYLGGREIWAKMGSLWREKPIPPTCKGGKREEIEGGVFSQWGRRRNEWGLNFGTKRALNISWVLRCQSDRYTLSVRPMTIVGWTDKTSKRLSDFWFSECSIDAHCLSHRQSSVRPTTTLLKSFLASHSADPQFELRGPFPCKLGLIRQPTLNSPHVQAQQIFENKNK